MAVDRYFDPDNPNSVAGDRSTGPAAGQAPGNGPQQQHVTYDPLTYGGGKTTLQSDPNGGPDTVVGPTSDQAELWRYRQRGEDAAKRQAYQLQFGSANQNRQDNLAAREKQLDANRLLATAAQGGAPSRAEIEGGQAAGNSLEDAMTAGAGTRGGGIGTQPRGSASPNQIAAMQQRSTIGGIDAATAARAGELTQARNAYGQSGNALRSGDTSLQGADAAQAEAQGQQEMAQRQRNLQAQMQNEQMGLNVEQSQVGASTRLANIQNKQNQADENTAASDEQNGKDTFKTLANSSVNAIKGGASDARAKEPAPLTALYKKARDLEASVNGQRDSLRYGSSLSSQPVKQETPAAGETAGEQDEKTVQQTQAKPQQLQTPANLYSNKKRPLLLSIDDGSDSGDLHHDAKGPYGSSQELPSDRIAAKERERQDLKQEVEKEVEKAPTKDYDNSMYHSGTDDLHSGIQKRLAYDQWHEQAIQQARDDQANDSMRHEDAHNLDQLAYGQPRDGTEGIGGAPKGYYATRQGEVGDVTGRGERATYDLGFGAGEKGGAPRAPGSEDFDATNPKQVSRVVPGSEGYIQGQEPHETVDAPMDAYSQEVSTSDERAKEQAYLTGVRHGQMPMRELHQDPEYLRRHAEEIAAQQKTEKEAGRAPLTSRSMLPSERETEGWRGIADDVYNFNERLTRPGEAPKRPQQPGPTTAKPVDQPNASQFDRGLQLQFGSPPSPEKPDARANEHLERSKVQKLIDTAGDRMSTSDERAKKPADDKKAKDFTAKKDKGAGGGEEEHDRTVMEHRGPALTESKGGNKGGTASRGVPGGGESVNSTATTEIHGGGEKTRSTLGSGGGVPRGVPGGGESVDMTDQTTEIQGGGVGNGAVGKAGLLQDPELQRDANRKLRGETYRYKEGVGEDTERVHHGFMAQTLEENPLTALAVREDGTGIKKVDGTDALRITAAGVAQLQEDNDQMRAELEALKARRVKRGRS